MPAQTRDVLGWRKITMADACTVDVELFESLEQAIAFVAERGGGVVHTRLAKSVLVRDLELPDKVRLEPPRRAVEPATAD